MLGCRAVGLRRYCSSSQKVLALDSLCLSVQVSGAAIVVMLFLLFPPSVYTNSEVI